MAVAAHLATSLESSRCIFCIRNAGIPSVDCAGLWLAWLRGQEQGCVVLCQHDFWPVPATSNEKLDFFLELQFERDTVLSLRPRREWLQQTNVLPRWQG